MPAGAGDRAIHATYAVALATFGALAIVVVVFFSRFGEETQWIQHTQEVLSRLERTLGEVRDIETGQCGFLIAGDRRFLEPYERASVRVFTDLDELQALTADNPEQQGHLRELRPLVEEKLAFGAETIRIYQAGQAAAALDMVRSGRGKAIMDDIRGRMAVMADTERRLLEQRSRQAERTAARTHVLIVMGNAFAFGFLALGTLLLGRELNRRKRLEQELDFRGQRVELQASADRAQRHLAAVVSEVPVGILLADPSGAIILDNARMRQLYGASLPGSRGPNALGMELARPEGNPYPLDEQPLARSLRAGEIVHAEEVQMRRADQTTVDVLVSSAPVRETGGRIIAAVGLFQEVAELRESRRERIETEQFRELFISALGHDLRNPLTVITTGAASLARHRQTEADGRIAARLASSAERMARMIAQLLDLVQSRLSGGLPLTLETTDLREITRSVIYRLDVQFPHRSIELSDDGALVGRFDHDRIAGVIHEVLQNALEHGRGDAPVRVRLQREGNDANIEVVNRGDVIPAAMLPLIFDPFRRAAERKRMRSAGLGLGLYLALQVVRAHQGFIHVDSSELAGTQVRIRLPLSHV